MIRFIDRADYNSFLASEGLKAIQDFWLFDEQAVGLQHYAVDGVWQKIELIEDADKVSFYRSMRDKLMPLAYDLDALAEKYPHLAQAIKIETGN